MHLIDTQLLLCRRQCAERRQYLAELERLATRLRADCDRLLAQIELAVGAGDRPTVGLLTERRQKVERSLAAIDEQLAAAGIAVAEADQELLRHERAFAHRAGEVAQSKRDRTAGRDRRARKGLSPPVAPDRG